MIAGLWLGKEKSSRTPFRG